jgi:hypothetical protein
VTATAKYYFHWGIYVPPIRKEIRKYVKLNLSNLVRKCLTLETHKQKHYSQQKSDVFNDQTLIFRSGKMYVSTKLDIVLRKINLSIDITMFFPRNKTQLICGDRVLIKTEI